MIGTFQNRWFFDDFPQFFQKFIPRQIPPNHQKIIDWIIKKSSILGCSNHFATCLMKTKGKSQNRWFFDDFPQFFRKIIPRPVSPNHQKIIDWIIKKSSGFQQFPGMLPKIIKKSSFESSIFSTFPPACHFFNHFETFSMKTKGIYGNIPKTMIFW